MKISDYSFDLPKEQIAQYPPEERGTANLLVLNRNNQSITHKNMQDFTDYIDDNTVVVFNNSRVRKARLFANTADSGGRVEFFMLNKSGDKSWEVMVRITSYNVCYTKLLRLLDIKRSDGVERTMTVVFSTITDFQSSMKLTEGEKVIDKRNNFV